MAELIIALDQPRGAAALALVDAVGDAGTWYKVGPILFVRDGPEVLAELHRRGKKVFLDLKWHDIPNTVAGAVAAAAALGVDLATVHLAGGPAMLRAAAAARTGGIRLAGVGVLTSMDAGAYAASVGRGVGDVTVEQQRLARLGVEAGLDGMVCSALEAAALRAVVGPDRLLVVPGIRRGTDVKGDQARTATPGEAVAAGADLLVVGRPITGAHDPAAAAREFRAALA